MKKSLSTVALAISALISTGAMAANEVNIYSYRQPYLIEPILKDFEKEKMISEDDLKLGEEELQKLTDKFITEIDKLGDHKEKEIMEV